MGRISWLRGKKKKNRRSRTWRISGPLAAVPRSGYAKPPNEFTQIVALSLGLSRADCIYKKVGTLLTFRSSSKRQPEPHRREPASREAYIKSVGHGSEPLFPASPRGSRAWSVTCGARKFSFFRSLGVRMSARKMRLRAFRASRPSNALYIPGPSCTQLRHRRRVRLCRCASWKRQQENAKYRPRPLPPTSDVCSNYAQASLAP